MFYIAVQHCTSKNIFFTIIKFTLAPKKLRLKSNSTRVKNLKKYQPNLVLMNRLQKV